MAAGPYQDYAVSAAQRYGVPTEMFLWQIGQESGWDPNARNPKSTATGLGQFVKGTAEMFKINPLDPYASLDAAAKYDAQLYAEEGTWKKALTRYGTLHDASPEVMAGFEKSMKTPTETNGMTWDNVLPTLKKFYDDSMAPLNGPAYTDKEKEGAIDYGSKFKGLMTSGALIILGIVVIGIAILSNKTVQTTVVTAVTKGKK